MEDILPSRRQSPVDRFRRRIELYRCHHNECGPTYDKTSHGLYEQQRHETHVLKQRFLEAKAKKVRKNDHKNTKETSCGERSLLGSKLAKRPVEVLGSPITSDGLSDDVRHPNKIARTSYQSDQNTIKSSSCDNKEQPPPHPLPSFSVQIVQQFTSSNVSHAQHSQTIQTNVTVKALNGSVKTSDSPLATATSSVSTDSPAAPGNGSVSLGANIECKQEKDVTGQCCNHNNDDLPNLDPTNDGPTRVERFSDTFSNLNFPDDSGDDVFHPDLLKDLIEDVFTNPSDLLIFDDSAGSVKDENDKDNLTSTMMDMGKLVGSPSSSSQFTTAQLSAGQSPQSTLFDLGSSINNNLNSPAATNFSNSNNLSGLGLDFKLTEPSPAALTLKQMAEQHQNMQQKQQHQPTSQTQPQQAQQQPQHHHHQQQQQQTQQQNISLGLGSPHSHSPFASDNFSDALTTIRSNFLNSTANNLNQVQKSGLYQPISFSRQPGYQGTPVRPNNMIFKQENFSSNPTIDELHKRQSLQQQINEQKLRPNFCGNSNIDQKPLLGLSGVAYGATRPLSHYTEPSGPGQRQSPGFLRAQTPRVTPPPTLQYSSHSSNVPRPQSAQTIHVSQTQQIQMNQANQCLQVSQEQQLRVESKQNQTSNSQQQSAIYVNYPPNSNNFHISQMQKINFSQYPTDSSIQNRFVQQPRPPPPEYVRHAGTGGAFLMQQQQIIRDRGLMVASQNQRMVQTGRNYQDTMQNQMGLHQNNLYSDANRQQTVAGNKPIYTNAVSKQQRPPNVNVGPDGLNISQRPPAEWRQNFQSQLGAVRVSYNRPQQQNYMTSNLDNYQSIRMSGTPNRSQRPSAASVPHLSVSGGRGYNQMTSPPIAITTANQLYDSVQLPVTTSNSTSESGQFSLDFLDNLDCSASEELLLEQVIQDSDSPFPLLEDMGLLGK